MNQTNASYAARFSTRRDAEMAVETLVQEHKFDRKAITLYAEGERNSAGPDVSGADADDQTGTTEGAHNGKIIVRVAAPTAQADDVRHAFAQYQGEMLER